MNFIKPKNEKGFITTEEIICFIIINVFVIGAHQVGSFYRRAFDKIAYEKIVSEENKKKKEKEELDKKQKLEREAAKKKQAMEIKKTGIIDITKNNANGTNLRSETKIMAKGPLQVKKIIFKTDAAAANSIKPNDQKNIKTNGTAAELKKTSENTLAKNNGNINSNSKTQNSGSVNPEKQGFSERFSSLFNFSELDSIGVELYDLKVESESLKHEMALIRLINKVTMKEAAVTANNEITYSVDTAEIASNTDETNLTQSAANGAKLTDTSEINLKQSEIVSKFLYKYKDNIYIGTNGGIYFVNEKSILDISKVTDKTKFKFEKFMPGVIPQHDTIAMCSNDGGNLLFFGTQKTIYIINLDNNECIDIGSDELFENSSWYSMYYHRGKLYLANYNTLFYFNIEDKKWHSIDYSKFTQTATCEIQNLIIYESADNTEYFSLSTNNAGIITGKMPEFDHKKSIFDKQMKYPSLKNIGPRDIIASKPAFAYADNSSIWYAFENSDSLPCELIRYDKTFERYEKYSKAEKLNNIYAIDMASNGKKITYATNGEDVYAIIKFKNIMDKTGKKPYSYMFMPLAKISGVFSITASDNYIICGTIDGKIMKIDVMDLISKVNNNED